VITKPQNVCVMRDVMCSGYVAGGNTRFFGQGKASFGGPVDAHHVQQGIDARLSFQNDAEGEYESMLAFGCGYNDGAKRDQVISITDRLLPWEINKTMGATKEYFPGGQKNYDQYRQAFNLNTIHFGEDVRASENMEFISQGRLAAPHSLHFAKARRQLTNPVVLVVRINEQWPLLRRSAPQVQPLLQPVPRAHTGSGPFWTGRDPRGKRIAHSTHFIPCY
tara:strand:- start:2124 stop:2786 length:663 start_codon:yes stop_codon:yes gene_type:complete